MFAVRNKLRWGASLSQASITDTLSTNTPSNVMRKGKEVPVFSSGESVVTVAPDMSKAASHWPRLEAAWIISESMESMSPDFEKRDSKNPATERAGRWMRVRHERHLVFWCYSDSSTKYARRLKAAVRYASDRGRSGHLRFWRKRADGLRARNILILLLSASTNYPNGPTEAQSRKAMISYSSTRTTCLLRRRSHGQGCRSNLVVYVKADIRVHSLHF